MDDIEPGAGLEIQILDEEGKPLSDLTLELESGDDSEDLSTDSEGKVQSTLAGKIKVTLEAESEESDEESEDDT